MEIMLPAVPLAEVRGGALAEKELDEWRTAKRKGANKVEFNRRAKRPRIDGKSLAKQAAVGGLKVEGKSLAKQAAVGGLKVEGKSMAKQAAEGGLKVEDKSMAKQAAVSGLKVEGKSMAKQAAEGGLTVDGKSMAKQAAEGGLKVEGRSMAKQAGAGKKKTKQVKFYKEYIEFVLKMGPPMPFPPLRRPSAVELELAEYAQKRIDRYEQIREQYEQKGYAEIEYTDDEDAEEIDDAQLIPLRYRKVTVKEVADMMGLPVPSRDA